MTNLFCSITSAQKAKAVAENAADGPHKLTLYVIFAAVFHFLIFNILNRAEKKLKDSGITIAPPKCGQRDIAPKVPDSKATGSRQRRSDLAPETPKTDKKGKGRARQSDEEEEDEEEENVEEEDGQDADAEGNNNSDKEGSVTPTQETHEPDGKSANIF